MWVMRGGRILLYQHRFGQRHLGTGTGLQLHRQQSISVRQQQAAASVAVLNRLPRLTTVGGERVPSGQPVGGNRIGFDVEFEVDAAVGQAFKVGELPGTPLS